MSSIKHIASGIVTNPKVGTAVMTWGFSVNTVMDFIDKQVNPLLATLTPLLSFILLIVLIITNWKKSKKGKDDAT